MYSCKKITDHFENFLHHAESQQVINQSFSLFMDLKQTYIGHCKIKPPQKGVDYI